MAESRRRACTLAVPTPEASVPSVAFEQSSKSRQRRALRNTQGNPEKRGRKENADDVKNFFSAHPAAACGYAAHSPACGLSFMPRLLLHEPFAQMLRTGRPRPSPRPPGRTRPWGAGLGEPAVRTRRGNRRRPAGGSHPRSPTRAARMTPIPLACLAAPPGAVQGPHVRPRRVRCVGQRPTRTVSWARAGRDAGRAAGPPRVRRPRAQPVSPRRPAWVRSCSPAVTSAKACPLHRSKNQQKKTARPVFIVPLGQGCHGCRTAATLLRCSEVQGNRGLSCRTSGEPTRDMMPPVNAR